VYFGFVTAPPVKVRVFSTPAGRLSGIWIVTNSFKLLHATEFVGPPAKFLVSVQSVFPLTLITKSLGNCNFRIEFASKATTGLKVMGMSTEAPSALWSTTGISWKISLSFAGDSILAIVTTPPEVFSSITWEAGLSA